MLNCLLSLLFLPNVTLQTYKNVPQTCQFERVGCETSCDGDKRAKESQRRYRPAINPPGNDINIPNCVWAVRFTLLFFLNLFPVRAASFVLLYNIQTEMKTTQEKPPKAPRNVKKK